MTAAMAKTSNPNAPYNSTTYITSQAGRDLRLFTERSRLISCMDPEVLVDGIQCYTVSVHQQLLFCLLSPERSRSTASAPAPSQASGARSYECFPIGVRGG